MDMKEIFENERLIKLEDELVRIFSNRLGEWDDFREKDRKRVEYLVDKRKYLLDKMFKMDENYKRLLSEFNEALKTHLVEMRLKAMDAFKALRGVYPFPIDMDLEVHCYLGPKYSEIHPVQTERAKQVWSILAEGIGTEGKAHHVPYYKSWGAQEYYCRTYEGRDVEQWEDEDEFLYLRLRNDPTVDQFDYNWNEGLDREMTKDMKLIYPFHNLYDHCYFALFDLLWVREFYSQLKVEITTAKDEDMEEVYSVI
ncbi:MAG: hypothetical protein LUD72_05995 [Bacteroidales bacterium]|nr:hypothetical protein [Bacteroidales bacterium]